MYLFYFLLALVLFFGAESMGRGKWNTEFTLDSKHEFVLNGFYGNIANIKLMDVYNQNTSEMMMQYPTNSHLLINDTARPLVGLLGTEQK